MPISDAEYKTWLNSSRNKFPVALVDITTPGGILRLSTSEYRTGNTIYRARLEDYEIEWEFDIESNDFSRPRIGLLVAENSDAKIDSWALTDHSTIRMLLGDKSWDKSDFRTQFSGQVYELDFDSRKIEIEIEDVQKNLDRVHPVASFNATPQLPGTKARQWLTNPGGVSGSDINVASFNAVDVAFPYQVQPDLRDEENVLSAIDKIFAGMPVDYGADREGRITAYILTNPSGGSTKRRFRPNTEPTCEVVAPVGQYYFRQQVSGGYESSRSRPAVQSQYPNFRAYSRQLSVVSATDAVLLVNKALALEAVPRHLISFDTGDQTSDVDLMEEVPVLWQRYGYKDTRYGNVVRLVERFRGKNELTVRV